MNTTDQKLAGQPAAGEIMSEGEMLLRQALASAQDAIFAIDRDYRLLFSNDCYNRALTATGSHPIGVGESVLSPDYPSDVLDYWRKAYDRALAEEIFRMESSWTDKTGLTFFYENNFSPLRNARGEIIGVLVVTHDITTHKQAEKRIEDSQKRFYTVFRSNPVPLGIADETDFRIVEVNDAWSELTGFTREEAIGHTAVELGLTRPEALQSIRNQIKEQGRIRQYGIPIYTRSGQERTVLVTSDPIILEGKAYFLNNLFDITAKKLAEEKLRESEKRFYTMFQINPLSIVLTRLEDGLVLDANDAFLKLFGYNREEVIGHTTGELQVYADPDDRMRLIARLKERGRLYNEEAKFRHRSGKTGTVSISAEILEIDGSMKMLSMMIDITERKQNEQLMRLWADAFEHCAHGIAIGLPDTNKIMTCNQAFARLQGRTIEEVSSMPILDMYVPEDQSFVKERIMEADVKGSVRYEARMVRKDGSRYPVQMDLVSVRDGDGNIPYRVATQQDITQRMQSSEQRARLAERLNLATHVAQIGIWDWDIQKNRLVWDEQMYFLYGLQPGEFGGAYEAWLNGVHPADRESSNELTMQAVRGEGEFDTEFRVVWPDGSVHWLKADGQVFRDEYGTPLRMVGVNYDITRRKHSELDLIKAKERAEESDRLKSHFLANISHEIRTPMNGILGFTDLVRTMNPTGMEREKFFDIIRASGERLMTTINDLIEVASLQAGAVNVTETEVNINEMLRFHHDFFDLQARQKGLQLNVMAPLPDDQAVVMTDKSKLNCILINLIRNSIKFTNSGTVEFGYKIEKSDIVFHVNDTGVGIPADRLDAIFERFVQADLKLTRAYEGSGLGLSIAKGYVEMLGGRIWVESKVGVGTAFGFTIPWSLPETTEVGNETAQTGDGADFLKERTILVVEDDKDNMIYFERLLTPLCKSVIIAGNGPEAIRICTQHNSISIVLMDIKMPGMDGYETTRQIRQFNPELVIIAQTAHASPAERNNALQAGCNDFITKPFYLNELLDILLKNIK